MKRRMKLKPKPRTIREHLDAQNGLQLHERSEFEPQPAERPTKARPRSKQKVAVLAKRVAMGQALWHPEDNSLAATRTQRVDAIWSAKGYRFGHRKALAE